jgi:hypothetical protein
MSNSADVQIIRPPNVLKAKLGGRLSAGFDAAAIAKAQAALEAMSGEFGQWLTDEVKRLEEAHAAARAPGAGETERENLYFRAHDLKGLGVTYGNALISRIAGSLCKLLDSPEGRAKAPTSLLDAHVMSIKAAARDNITTAEHPVGAMLVKELEAKVAVYAAGEAA